MIGALFAAAVALVTSYKALRRYLYLDAEVDYALAYLKRHYPWLDEDHDLTRRHLIETRPIWAIVATVAWALFIAVCWTQS